MTEQWEYVRMTVNHYSNAPVTDVTSPDIRCYQAGNGGSSTQTANVTAGTTVGFSSSPATYHPGPLSFYMAKAPAGISAAEFDGAGDVWFKIWEDHPKITPSSITWPNTGWSLSDFFPFLFPFSPLEIFEALHQVVVACILQWKTWK